MTGQATGRQAIGSLPEGNIAFGFLPPGDELAAPAENALPEGALERILSPEGSLSLLAGRLGSHLGRLVLSQLRGNGQKDMLWPVSQPFGLKIGLKAKSPVSILAKEGPNAFNKRSSFPKGLIRFQVSDTFFQHTANLRRRPRGQVAQFPDALTQQGGSSSLACEEGQEFRCLLTQYPIQRGDGQ